MLKFDTISNPNVVIVAPKDAVRITKIAFLKTSDKTPPIIKDNNATALSEFSSICSIDEIFKRTIVNKPPPETKMAISKKKNDIATKNKLTINDVITIPIESEPLKVVIK